MSAMLVSTGLVCKLDKCICVFAVPHTGHWRAAEAEGCKCRRSVSCVSVSFSTDTTERSEMTARTS